MKRRPVPLDRPERWPFVRVNLEGVDGSPWVFRMPRSSQLSHVFGPWLALFEKDGDNFRAIADKLEGMPIAAASILAEMWAHPELEIDEAHDPENVIEQLHDAGLREQVMVALVGKLFEKMTMNTITEGEVAKRADFFGETES